MKFWQVVFWSFLLSALFLGLERVAGIGWDFHPDSVTYATLSEEMYASIEENWILLLNNGYYVISYLLGQSIVLITVMNMMIFALTNGMIYKLIQERSLYPTSTPLLLLLLLNPYRIHLSTTMLKDTVIIFLMVLFVRSAMIGRAVSFVGMVVLRIASPIYLFTLIPRKWLPYAALASAFLFAVYWDAAVGRVLEFNEQEMQLREFDHIPTFQEFGFSGSILRGIVWSCLAFSGTFPFLSPAPAFFPVAIGSVMTIFFLKRVTGNYKIPMQLFIATSLFGVMVTGFTAYIRYVYPILVAWPLVAVTND